MAKTKTVFVCQNCGCESPKWIGKCYGCGEWNTYVEEVAMTKSAGNTSAILMPGMGVERAKPIALSDVNVVDVPRSSTSNGELDRVL